MGAPIVIPPARRRGHRRRAGPAGQLLSDRDALHATWSRFGAGREGADLHVHYKHSDVFYVLAGELTVRLGAEDAGVAAPAGTLVRVPPLVVHGFRNASATDVRYLNFHAPGQRFRGLHARLCVTAARSSSTRRRRPRTAVARWPRRRSRARTRSAAPRCWPTSTRRGSPRCGSTPAPPTAAARAPRPCRVALRARGRARLSRSATRGARRAGRVGPGAAGRAALRRLRGLHGPHAS